MNLCTNINTIITKIWEQELKSSEEEKPYTIGQERSSNHLGMMVYYKVPGKTGNENQEHKNPASAFEEKRSGMQPIALPGCCLSFKYKYHGARYFLKPTNIL